MKIYITGCAKTGTTLVRRLFNAFELKVFNEDEMTLEDFAASDYEVAKRTSKSLFSDELTRAEIKLRLKRTVWNRITIVNVVRSKEQVLASSGGYVSEERYEACMKQASHRRLKRLIKFTIEYDALLENPDKVQLELADKLGLKIKYNWSYYPKFIETDSEDEQALDEYELRPIGRK